MALSPFLAYPTGEVWRLTLAPWNNYSIADRAAFVKGFLKKI